MKIRKYGYSPFNKSTELRFAVIVIVQSFAEKKPSWRFVTTIETFSKTWKAENKKPAYLFRNRQAAQDFCIALAWNFTEGFVVEVLEGMEPSNNW